MDVSGLEPLADLVRAVRERPVLVGLAGGVAVGKTTTAAALARLLAPLRVEVVATDGFLLPNAELVARGLLLRKGFPESYDTEWLERFLDAARAGDDPLSVPVYSHETYDRLPEPKVVRRPDVLIVEGVNALRFADRYDVAVYLEADAAAMEEWYVERFLELCEAADPDDFYFAFAALGPQGAEDAARSIWESVNLPNLFDHIAATRSGATVVVHKDADHTIRRVEVREP